MKEAKSLSLKALIGDTIEKYPNHNALSYVDEKPLSYAGLGSNIQALIAFFEKLGIAPADKVAILSTNMPNWGVAYLATTFMGAVSVPLLPDFTPAEIENILTHSGTKAIFVSSGLLHKMESIEVKTLEHIILIEDFSIYRPEDDLLTPKHNISLMPKGKDVVFDPRVLPHKQYKVHENDMAAIIYTSGTTGHPKGVMLSHLNISFVAIKSKKIQPIVDTDRFLSILPLSHTLENTLCLILPLISGASVYYLRKPPTASVLLPALAKIRPTIMLTVPMIIEKIYRSKIEPKFKSSLPLKMLYKVPPIRKKLNAVAGKKLMETFGGKLKFFGIGGAKLNSTVEQFLHEANFPYAIGYGLTETAPLLAGAGVGRTRVESTGPAMEGVTLRINKPDKKTGEGEIWAKGPNVMMGYYKDPELTREIITPDGWFKTGDLGVLDKDNYLFIKGRLKNMILGANGENIYPEEIESLINNFRYVVESVVVQKKGKLVALVHFNREELEKRYQDLKEEVADYVEKSIEDLRAELQIYLNTRLNKFSRVEAIISHPSPFSKTATQKIKRFLYV